MEVADLSKVLGTLAQIKRIQTDSILFHRGDPTECMYGVLEGKARLIRHTIDGTKVTLHQALPGAFFAEASLFAESYHCDGEVEAGSVVMAYPKAAVLAKMSSDTDFAQTFCQHMAGQVQKLRSAIELRGIRSAEERVMAALSFRLRADENIH